MGHTFSSLLFLYSWESGHSSSYLKPKVSRLDAHIVTVLTMTGITLEEMDALFMKRMHKAVWAQLRGRPIVEDRPSPSSLADEKLGAQFEQIEKKPSE
jgi:hypothetical protein